MKLSGHEADPAHVMDDVGHERQSQGVWAKRERFRTSDAELKPEALAAGLPKSIFRERSTPIVYE